MDMQPVLVKEHRLAGHAMQYQPCWDETTAWQRQAHGTPLHGLSSPLVAGWMSHGRKPEWPS